MFPRLPERTRLFRLFTTHQDWTRAFLGAPTVLGVIDTYGIELIHPRREGRSAQQIGRKGLSNHRWIVGGNLCLLLNQYEGRERTLAWIGRQRRLSKDYERKVQTSETLLQLAMIRLMVRRLARSLA